jgi:hypothetical protein
MHSSQSPKKNVSFHRHVMVIEVERVQNKDVTEVWWTSKEMDKFRSDASKCKDRRRIGMRRSARASSHSRKILLQQRASEELDGMPSDPKYLAKISAESSSRSKEVAYKTAKTLEREVQSENQDLRFQQRIIQYQKPPSIPSCYDVVDERQVADFYWGGIFEAFTETVTCGIVSR